MIRLMIAEEITDRKSHWENIYCTKATDAVSWYSPHLETSMQLTELAGLPEDARIIDVGGGASTLVDDLIEAGYSDVTVLDISARALDKIRERLGLRSGL